MSLEQVKKFKKFGIEWVKVVHSPYRVKKYILGIKVVDEFKFEDIFRALEDKVNGNSLTCTNERAVETINLHGHITEAVNNLHMHLAETHDNITSKLDGSTITRDINRLIQKNISTAIMQQKTFLQFKNINQGKEVVLVATGPTVTKYKSIENAVHLGVNRAYKLEDIKFDYLFAQDYYAIKSYISEMNEYLPNDCIKFYGLTTEFDAEINRVIPEDDAIKANAYRYRTDWSDISNFQPEFAYDITSQPLGCFGSVVFPAMQFLLWTNPKKIYLVGCDCSSEGYFDGGNQPEALPLNIVEIWANFKEFAHRYYPEIEIISINPIGLKGLFKDVYTK